MTLRRDAPAEHHIDLSGAVFVAVAVFAAVLLLIALSTVFGGVQPTFREPLPL